MKHDVVKEKQRGHDIKDKLKNKSKIEKEFSNIIKVEDKYFAAEFAKTQAKEIIKYLHRLRLSPLKAWESFIRESINRNKDVFLYDFYLIENEFGELELDNDRINELILQDPVEDPL